MDTDELRVGVRGQVNPRKSVASAVPVSPREATEPPQLSGNPQNELPPAEAVAGDPAHSATSHSTPIPRGANSPTNEANPISQGAKFPTNETKPIFRQPEALEAARNATGWRGSIANSAKRVPPAPTWVGSGT